MNLYFLDSRDNKRLVKENVESENAMSYITQFINNLNPTYKIHYYRTWETKDGTMYDVGSHSEFFLLGK